VTTASYEARQYGIDSAMPAARARALCAHAIFVEPDHKAYREKSREVWDLVRSRAEVVQQVGIDEAYLDVTSLEKPMPALRELVAEIEQRTGMVMSIGIGPSRLVAKTVSGSFKPRAFVAMSRQDACERFASKSVRILQGVGPKTAERLAELGIQTVGDLQAHDAERLVERFGERMGRYLESRAFFFDSSPVEKPGAAKSRSNETTFPFDVSDGEELEATIVRLAEGLCGHLQKKEVAGRTIAIKVRLDDWTTVTRAHTVAEPTNDEEPITTTAVDLLRAYAPPRPVRLLGVRVAAFGKHAVAAEAEAEEPQAEPQLDLGLSPE